MVRAPVSGHWHWPGRSAAHIPTVLQQSSRQQMLLRGWDQSGGRYGLARHSQQHWKRRQRSARTSGTGGSGDEPGGQPGHVADGEGDAGPARDLRAETYATRRRADATSGATAGAALGQRRGRTGRRRQFRRSAARHPRRRARRRGGRHGAQWRARRAAQAVPGERPGRRGAFVDRHRAEQDDLRWRPRCGSISPASSISSRRTGTCRTRTKRNACSERKTVGAAGRGHPLPCATCAAGTRPAPQA